MVARFSFRDISLNVALTACFIYYEDNREFRHKLYISINIFHKDF